MTEDTSDKTKDFLSSQYLTIEDASSKELRRISYYKVNGSSDGPGVVFVPGFMANKEHTKSIELLKFCFSNNIPCVSYDTTGFGESIHEVKRTEARFTHWLQDAREVILQLTNGPQVVIGSSMGGWLSMILSLELRATFAGLVLLAPAYNFGEKILREEIEPRIPAEIKEQMRKGFVFERVDPLFPGYGPVPISYDLFEGMIPFDLPLEEGAIDLPCPVRLIHGTEDEIFPTTSSSALISAVSSDDVTMTVVKGSKHELSDPSGLRCIVSAVQELRSLAKGGKDSKEVV